MGESISPESDGDARIRVVTGTGMARLSKLHGLGNDFLVVIPDPDDESGHDVDWAGRARRVCDRHRGVGADGLLIAEPGDEAHHWTMTLFNADGSRAEMSGNGIRCFAHAIVRRVAPELPAWFVVTTDAGEREVTVREDPTARGSTDRVLAIVDMGRIGPGPTPTRALPATPEEVHRTATVDVGNPHIVVEVDDPTSVDLVVEGPAWEEPFVDGINVHFIRADDPHHLTLAVWERGAGITQACGTGATAAAVVGVGWDIVRSPVEVSMPGGTVTVTVADQITLTGPSEWIADVEVCW